LGLFILSLKIFKLDLFPFRYLLWRGRFTIARGLLVVVSVVRSCLEIAPVLFGHFSSVIFLVLLDGSKLRLVGSTDIVVFAFSYVKMASCDMVHVWLERLGHI
jgi:hypothetical protein